MSGLFDQVVNYSPPLLTSGQVNYDGTWNAATNTPTLVSPPDALSKGDYYVVSAAGTQFGISFAVGDWIISNGTAWEKVDLTDAVSSVFGRTGAVVGDSTDYSAVGLTNTAIGAANPSTGAFTSLSSSSTTTLNGTTIPASKTLVVTTDKLSALAATTSAELAGVISDETGSGSLVFANSPTLVTPALGTPSALVGTNITGTAAAFNINGTVGATTPSTVAATSVAALSNSGYQAVVGQLTSGDRVGISGQASGSGTALVFFDNAQTTFRPAIFDASSHSLKISGVEKASVTSTGLQGAIGATTPSTGVFSALTVNDNSTLGSSNTDTVNFNARVASDINPSADDTYDLGVTGHEWRNLNIDGTANIDSLVADTADINGGTIDGTTVGATTPSTVAATSLSLSPFILSAASTSVLRFSGTQAANVLQGFDGTNAYGITLFDGAAANVVIQSNNASSFAGGINNTSIGSGGVSTGAFSTLSATGQITSTVSTGTAPFVVASTTNVANLNASSLNGATFAAPGAIGSGTASTGAFTTISSTTGANFATSSGSVGIGTASPTAKLHIDSGTQKLVKTVTVNSSTQTIVTNSAEGVSGLCWIRDASTGGQALVLWDISHGLTIASQLGSIFTTSAPSATEIQLSVGGTSPYYVQAIAGATRNGDLLSVSAINNQ